MLGTVSISHHCYFIRVNCKMVSLNFSKYMPFYLKNHHFKSKIFPFISHSSLPLWTSVKNISGPFIFPPFFSSSIYLFRILSGRNSLKLKE